MADEGVELQMADEGVVVADRPEPASTHFAPTRGRNPHRTGFFTDSGIVELATPDEGDMDVYEGSSPGSEEGPESLGDGGGGGEIDVTPAVAAAALASGFSQQEVDGLGSDSAILAAMAFAQRSGAGRGNANGGAADQGGEPPNTDVDIPEFDAEEMGEKNATAFKVMAQIVKDQQKKISSLERDGTERAKTTYRATRQSAVHEFDSCVEKLGEDFHDVLGKGKSDELKPNSKEWKNRDRVFKYMELLKAGDNAVGESPISADERLAVALFRIFPKKSQSRERSRIARQIESHSGSMLHPPSGRETRPGLSRPQKAFQAVKAKMKGYGLPA